MDSATADLFPKEFSTSTAGEIPSGWRLQTLSESTSYLNRGVSPKYVEDGGVLVINQKCIRDFVVDLSKARRHDTLQRNINGREVRVGDVLVNSTGVGTLGRVAQVLTLGEAAVVDSHVTLVRANSALTYNYLGLAMMRMQPLIESMGEGTTGQTELSRVKLGRLQVVVPSQAVLQAFDHTTQAVRDRFAANSEQAHTLATLRDTLLPRLISGQLRLPEAEAAIDRALAAT
jgi:type I restriction enzyme, S subunit